MVFGRVAGLDFGDAETGGDASSPQGSLGGLFESFAHFVGAPRRGGVVAVGA